MNFSSSLDSGSGSAPSGSGGVSQSQHLPLVALSPIIHPRIREFRSGPLTTAAPRRDLLASPLLSLHERYSSPAAGSAKRRLFGDDNLPPSAEAATPPRGSPAPSPAKRLTFGGGSGGTLRIGALPTQTTVLSIPLQGDTHMHTHIYTHTHIQRHAHAHTCTHAHIHTHTHTRGRINRIFSCIGGSVGHF